jgi:hypothetical protein
MRSYIFAFFVTLIAIFCFFDVEAAPTALFWTNSSTEIQAYQTLNISSDTYFTVFNRRGKGQSFPPLTGALYGFLSWGDLQGEMGVDYLGGANDPLYFNIKVGVKEDKLFKNAPAFNVGMFNIGTRCRGSNPTNQCIINFIFGKSFTLFSGDEKEQNNLYISGFSGQRAMGKNRYGFAAGYARKFQQAKDCKGVEYYKWWLLADYASGKNTVGGGGAGVSYFFTPDFVIMTGPVFFNSASIYGRWKWTVQINLSFPVL